MFAVIFLKDRQQRLVQTQHKSSAPWRLAYNRLVPFPPKQRKRHSQNYDLVNIIHSTTFRLVPILVYCDTCCQSSNRSTMLRDIPVFRYVSIYGHVVIKLKKKTQQH